ncbi:MULTISPECIES: hypothetical protein [Burkholderia]|uniref:hypothetical protein n=1 Tax=Burkholderia TaxID=32008 RepID=UPI0012E3A2F9|nr:MULTISPECIES: hypothetical protein [Burkholderia]
MPTLRRVTTPGATTNRTAIDDVPARRITARPTREGRLANAIGSRISIFGSRVCKTTSRPTARRHGSVPNAATVRRLTQVKARPGATPRLVSHAIDVAIRRTSGVARRSRSEAK